jgi:hypothetical protein
MSLFHFSDENLFMLGRIIILFIAILIFVSAYPQQKIKGPLFTLLEPKKTGVKFTNTVRENDSLNVFNYEYLYNGHGIGVADFNNDGLQDIFISGNAVPNKLFLNKGDLVFEDITKQAGVAGNGTWATGVSIADVNGDHLPDIYVCHSGKHSEAELANELFINSGNVNGIPHFVEQAKKFSIDAPGTQSTQAAFFDYDLDGDLDMFLLNHSNHSYNPFLNTRKQRATPDFHFGNRLFRNDKKADNSVTFTDVTLQSGIINNALNFGLGIAISDINQDGWPDIYTTSDYTEQDCYYVNNHDGTFTQSLQKSFTHVSKYSMGVDIADYNNDGRPDVFTLDMLPEDNHRQKLLKGPDEYDQYHLLLDSGYYHQQMRNMLHLNRGKDEEGNIRFSEIGQLAGVSNTDWSWAGLFADLDNDGWKDLVITNGYLRDYTDMDFLKYTVSEAQLNEAAKGNLNFKTYDLVKKMPSNKLNNYLFRNNGDLSFSNVSADWAFNTPSVSNAAVYADLDNDGDVDLIVGNNNEPVMIYRNNAEKSFSPAHYLQIKLVGENQNTFAFGANVTIFYKGRMQYQEQYPVRGFQSSVSPILNFGLGNMSRIDSLIVNWPKGKRSVLTSVKVDQLLTINQKDAASIALQNIAQTKPFELLKDKAGINFIHQENDFIDFKNEVLIPYQYSKNGPALAKADVNGDGLEDIFLGGAIGQSGVLYLQTKEGKFAESSSQPWKADAESEDVNALFFDADNDGDQDLYVVSGGNEYEAGSPEYADRFYINEGAGNFASVKTALPQMLNSKQAVAAGDFDNDGDMDLFVGGSCVPGSFPLAGRSYLLRNDSKGQQILFTDITETNSKELLNPGMVMVATWTDLNKDGYPELVIAGDWMPVEIYNNAEGKLSKYIAKGIANSNGMWASITADDIDNDGDIDFILGNCGLNNQFKPSVQEPMTTYVSDFDDNGLVDPIVCYYVKGKSYPMASRDELLDQITPLRKKFIKYKDYADASIEDIFSKQKLQAATTYNCYQSASSILLNDGKNNFTIKALPVEAQFSKIYSIAILDFDKDGKKDLLLTGNFFPYRTQLGRSDASLGLLLKGKGDGSFEAFSNDKLGLYIDGDIRNMVMLQNGSKEKLFIIARNNDAVQVVKLKNE